MNTRTSLVIGLTLVAALGVDAAQDIANAPAETRTVTVLAESADVRAALDAARADEPQVIEDQIRFCEIPAPPFKEAARARAMRTVFQQLGLTNIRSDKAGNVLGERPGVSARPHLVVAAHLDTVFPEGTDVRVRRSGPVLSGPGIGDNCRGLAAMIAIVRSLQRADIKTHGSVTFVADVGEEGLGDLRGMKQLFGDTLKGKVDRFVSIDGAGLFLANTAVGSRRYRVTFKGPGGHSFAAFGAANPIQAMGRAIARISQLQVPAQPKTTFNVGRVSGGTSINAIPSECWMEIDLRSSDPAALAALDAGFLGAVDAAVREENDRPGARRAITVVKELVGDRPSGQTPASAPVVQTALAAARVLGMTISPAESSTDANVPIQLGIPAITVGAGGRGADSHTAGETFDTTEAWKGTQYAVLLTIALAAK
jgi:tripeptide aminopeptidase